MLGTKSQMIICEKDYLAGLFTPFEAGKGYPLLRRFYNRR